MAGKIRGFFNRLYAGTEKSEGYARSTLPTNRWEQFWDIFKGRYGKLVLLNLVEILCFIPLILLIYLKYIITVNYGAVYPYGQGFGVGYQAPISLVGFQESIAVSVNTMIFAFLPVVSIFVAIGFAGGACIIKNMVWTNGFFSMGDFARGVKQNFKQIVLVLLIYSFFLYTLILAISLINQYIATNASLKWLFIVLEILAYALIVFASVMLMHAIELSTTYKYKFTQLIRNSFIFTLGSFIPSVLLIALGVMSYLVLFLGSSWFLVGLLAILLLGFSFLMLIWTVFSQWCYDKYLNPKTKGAKINRGIYEKAKDDREDTLKQYKSQINTIIHTSLNDRPIKPITDEELRLAELPDMFSREDIAKLNQSKQDIYDAQAKYAEEHKHEEKYKFNQQDKERDDERIAREKRIEEAKRQLAKRENKKK